MPNTELGDPVSSHPVDHARRRAIAGWGLGVGAVGVVVVAVVMAGGFERSTLLDLTAAVTGVALGGGGHAMAFAVRGGPNERFVVHTDGLSYTNRSGTRQWRWADLAHIRVRRPRFPGPGADFFGSRIRAAIHPRTGRPVRLTGLTHDPDGLVTAVRAHCDPAPPIPFRDRARWLGLTVAALAAIPLLVLYAHANRRITDYDDGTLVVVRPGLGTTGTVLILAALLACLLTAVLGLVKASRRS